jgi:hypothetical protein
MATTFSAIATATLTSTATSITFSSIPQTYTHLWVIGQVGTTYTTGTYMFARPNNVSTNTYDYQHIYVNTGGITQQSNSDTDKSAGLIELITSTGNSAFTGFEIVYPLYKSGLGNNLWLYNGNTQRTSGSNDNRGICGVASNAQTTAITSLVFSLQYSASFDTGTKITLYGLD